MVEAERAVSAELAAAIRLAAGNIERFHRHQLPVNWWDSGPGRLVGQRYQPLSSVGVYVPGGTAVYPSSVLMTVVPARVAGVKKIVLCTPPSAGGAVSPLILFAARVAGATAVYKIGGAQAIAALAYGTESVPAVPKIVGPGNLYVTLAKREVFGRVGIDLLAGPSEVLVVAGDGADASFVAADLISQAEHGSRSRAFLVTDSREILQAVMQELKRQLAALPRRETAARALKEQGAAVLVPSLDDAWPVVNELAPEHLSLHLPEPWSVLGKIENAGAIFLGSYSPESLGDYWAGTNHVLPTAGTARYASPLGVADFMKVSHLLYYGKEALLEAVSQIELLAGAEGLEGHARAAGIRRSKHGQNGKD